MKLRNLTALAAFFVVFYPNLSHAQDSDCMTTKQADEMIEDGFMAIEGTRQREGYLQFLVRRADGKFLEYTFFPPEMVCVTQEFHGDPRIEGAAL